MAITFTAARGNANGGTAASTTIGVSPNANLDVGDEIVIVATADNVGTTDADDTGEIASVADNSTQTGTANSYSKLKERRRSAGAAADGAVVAVFRVRLTRAVLTTDTITVTFANSVAGRTVSISEAASGAALQLATNGVGTGSGNSSTPSAATGTMTSKEYLLVGALAHQGGTNVTITEDADYTQGHDFSTGGSTAVHMRHHVATRIATLATDTYAPGLSLVRVWAEILVALEEAGGTLFTKDLAGTITPAGALAKQIGKPVGGTVTPAGALTRQPGKALAGTVTPAGALTRSIGKILAGTIIPAGVVATTKVILRSFAGTVTPAGALTRSIGKILAGTVTPDGVVTKRTAKSFAGTITPAGALTRSIGKTLAGGITPVGALIRSIGKVLAGTITPAGSVANVHTPAGGAGPPSAEYSSGVVTTDLSSGASGGEIATSSSGQE